MVKTSSSSSSSDLTRFKLQEVSLKDSHEDWEDFFSENYQDNPKLKIFGVGKA